MSQLLKPQGSLIGVYFDSSPNLPHIKRPFGASFEEYMSYFLPYFQVDTFELCYNSIPPRMGKEFFAILKLKQP